MPVEADADSSETLLLVVLTPVDTEAMPVEANVETEATPL
jgi:hypothetical protein